MKLAVLFEGSFREGAIVRKENALAVGKLLVAFIFQKTVTVEYPGGLDRTEKLYNKQWRSVNDKNDFAGDNADARSCRLCERCEAISSYRPVGNTITQAKACGYLILTYCSFSR